MNIAVVTDDQATISRHFGRARYYLVFTIQDRQVIHQELRPKQTPTSPWERHSMAPTA